MQSKIDRELVLDTLLVAAWRRQPKHEVIVHSDQRIQYGSHDWQAFLKAHGLVASVSRRGNCHDNAAAESFFQLLKRERVGAGSIRAATLPAGTCSSALRCSTTR